MIDWAKACKTLLSASVDLGFCGGEAASGSALALVQMLDTVATFARSLAGRVCLWPGAVAPAFRVRIVVSRPARAAAFLLPPGGLCRATPMLLNSSTSWAVNCPSIGLVEGGHDEQMLGGSNTRADIANYLKNIVLRQGTCQARPRAESDRRRSYEPRGQEAVLKMWCLSLCCGRGCGGWFGCTGHACANMFLPERVSLSPCRDLACVRPISGVCSHRVLGYPSPLPSTCQANTTQSVHTAHGHCRNLPHWLSWKAFLMMAGNPDHIPKDFNLATTCLSSAPVNFST